MRAATDNEEIFTSFGIALRQLQVWLVAGGGAIASAPFCFWLAMGNSILDAVSRPLPTACCFADGHDADRLGSRCAIQRMVIGQGRPTTPALLIGLFIAFAALVIAIYVPELSPTVIGALMLVNGLASGVIVLTYAMAGDLAPETGADQRLPSPIC